MIEIEKPRIETTDLKPDGTYGKFIVEPGRGYVSAEKKQGSLDAARLSASLLWTVFIRRY